MKLGKIYEFVVKKGQESDPRSRDKLQEAMQRTRREFNALEGPDKQFYDREKLSNPYADTRILHGEKSMEIRTIMVGIDIEAGELLTAYLLNREGAGIDLVMSHHPSGNAMADLYEVMQVQTDILQGLGLNIDTAKRLMKERMEEVSRKFLPINHQRAVDIAKLLDIPFMCVHTPADNHVAEFLKCAFDRKKPKLVSQALGFLKTIPEYQDAMRKSAGPKLVAGKEKNKAGKIFVDMTGGTEGSKKVYPRLSQAGIGTVIGMHLSEEHIDKAKGEDLNIIIAGHIASDTLGLNLLLDRLSKKGDFNIIPCSGFVRIRR